MLIGLLFLDPGIYTLHHFAKPHTEIVEPGVMLPEEIRPVMAYVRSHEHATDLVYIFYGSEPAFDYYAERDNFPRNNVRSELHRATIRTSMNLTCTGCVDTVSGSCSRTFMVRARKNQSTSSFIWTRLGPRLDSFVQAGAETYLYDLRGATVPAAVPLQTGP